MVESRLRKGGIEVDDWEETLRLAIPTAGELGFAYAKALEEIASLRRALKDSQDTIKAIQEFVGRSED